MRTHGFRFSATDGVFLLFLAAGAWWFRESLGPVVGAFLFVPLHFFLFCNVFRIRRSYELIWSAAFLGTVGSGILAGRLDWVLVGVLVLPLTVLLIVLEMRSPRYHGVASERINPDLDHWLAGREPSRSPPRRRSK